MKPCRVIANALKRKTAGTLSKEDYERVEIAQRVRQRRITAAKRARQRVKKYPPTYAVGQLVEFTYFGQPLKGTVVRDFGDRVYVHTTIPPTRAICLHSVLKWRVTPCAA